jgi:hypothetical protein
MGEDPLMNEFSWFSPIPFPSKLTLSKKLEVIAIEMRFSDRLFFAGDWYQVLVYIFHG